ncbi:hypothetical protein RRG08_024503 [Elysia crispata]|uniref:Uncharacterized protein n=1 Tax=Elysia crispata TaxID=231223 RepID=A0AAE0YP67_9GAST|nr:hypothetical protein RRG08_024503 [Elysia crispata]
MASTKVTFVTGTAEVRRRDNFDHLDNIVNFREANL